MMVKVCLFSQPHIKTNNKILTLLLIYYVYSAKWQKKKEFPVWIPLLVLRASVKSQSCERKPKKYNGGSVVQNAFL